MKSWAQLNAFEREEIAKRLPIEFQERVTFPELGRFYDVIRLWLLETKQVSA